MVRIFAELRRRSVFRAAAAYIVISWLVLQVVDVLGDILQLPAWPGQLILLALAVGFPIVLIISWLYELTPDGLRRDSSTSGEAVPSDPAIARKVDYIIISVLAATVALLVASNYLLPRLITDEEGLSITSVAVLPFVNMNSDPETEYFSDGLSEELLNVLAQVRDFRVPGRTSSFAFKNRNEDLREIGALLNVKHILEGSVRQQGDKIRITAQLNDVDTGFHRWSNTYDRELSNIFEVQDDIATEVARALKNILLDEDREVIARRATESVSAYQSFLHGMHFRSLRTIDGSQRALAEFKRAAEYDPDYSSALAGQVLAYASLWNSGVVDQDELIAIGNAALERALHLNPDDHWVQFAKGVWSDDREVKVRAYERAIELNPNDPNAYISLAWALPEGFIDGAGRRLELLRKAYETDPLSLAAVEQYSIQLANVGDVDRALQLLYGLREFNPEWLGTYETTARLLESRGRIAEAAAELTTLYSMHPDIAWIPIWLARLHMLWEDFGAAQEYLDAAKEADGLNNHVTIAQASLIARRGNVREAYQHLVQSVESNDRRGFYNIYLAQLAILSGDATLAAEHIDKFFAAYPDNEFLDWHMTAAVAYKQIGRISEAEKKARWVIGRANKAEATGQVHWWWPQTRSAMNAVLGDRDAALRDLRITIDLGYTGIPLMGVRTTFPQLELFFPDLLDDPDFQKLHSVIDQRIDAARESYEANSIARDSVAL